MSDLPSRIKKLREEKGLTQRQFADQFQISPSTIALYEVGKRTPDADTLSKLASFFDVSVDYLLGRTNERKPSSADKPKDLDEMIAIALSRSDGHSEPLPPEAVDEIKAAIDYARRKYNLGPYRKKDN